MFDVIWTDPDRELVGEHRAKKEKKREMQQSREKDKSISSRSSMSMRSSRSSTDSPFGFLRSRGLKPSISDKSNSKSKSTVSSGLLTPSILSSRSPLSTDSDAGSYRHSAQADTSSVYSETVPAETSERSSSGPDTSQVVSALGSASYVTKRTEVTWKPRYSDTDCQDVLSEILISSEPDIEQPMTPPSSPRNRSMPLPLLRSDSPVAFIPGLRIPSQPKAPLALTFAPNNPEAWRPPEEWDCVSPESRIADLEQSINEMQISGSNKSPRLSSNFDLLQKEVKRMAAANPEVVLSRLKEVWSTAQDENLYRELEMEKKRWMLSALRHLDPVPQCNTPGDSMADLPSATASTVLALYESRATASYLAALHPTTTVYHMSATPLSHTQFPNVHPVYVPSVSPSVCPLAPQLFDIVYSLSMPSICSSPDIPGILRNVHKSLKQGGSLQMTLIDPLPCAGLGRRMRTWLEEHLLLNLEKNFRCMNPSKLFPGWLGEASLRGRGSTMTSAKFYAVPTSVRYPDGDSDPFVDQARIDEAVRAEVRSLVGRMLWMEVWGAYVTADKWWWEDEGCVEECLELATFWEYKIIEGVKDS